ADFSGHANYIHVPVSDTVTRVWRMFHRQRRNRRHEAGLRPDGLDTSRCRTPCRRSVTHAADAQRPTMSSGRTGTRLSSRPVAARRAATTAAVETTVGG